MLPFKKKKKIKHYTDLMAHITSWLTLIWNTDLLQNPPDCDWLQEL